MLLQPRRQKRLRRAPSRLRGILIKVVLVAILLVVVEVAARACVGTVASRSVDRSLIDVRDVNVKNGDVPMVFHYWIMGGLRNGSITLYDISASPMNIHRLDVTASDLRFDRFKLLTAKARLNGSPPYRITMTLSGANLSGVIHSAVTFRGNHLISQIDGDNIDVAPKLEGREIVLSDERNTHRVELPGPEFLPCDPTGMGTSGAGITVTCESDTLPPYLAEATR